MVRISQTWSAPLSNFGLSFSDDTYLPYCLTFISSGLSPAFSCDSTSSPRTHSFVPLAAYYPSLSPTPSTTLPDASSIPTTESSHDKAKPSKLSTSKRVGIGIGTGLGPPGVIFVIVLYLRRKQKRTRASPTAGDAERVIAQTKNTPPGHQSAVQPVQQYQPHSENITFPEPVNMPPSPGPSWTSGGQHMSAAPIRPYEQTNDTKIARIPQSIVAAALNSWSTPKVGQLP